VIISSGQPYSALAVEAGRFVLEASRRYHRTDTAVGAPWRKTSTHRIARRPLGCERALLMSPEQGIVSSGLRDDFAPLSPIRWAAQRPCGGSAARGRWRIAPRCQGNDVALVLAPGSRIRCSCSPWGSHTRRSRLSCWAAGDCQRQGASTSTRRYVITGVFASACLPAVLTPLGPPKGGTRDQANPDP
jgi:hypothetical protein